MKIVFPCICLLTIFVLFSCEKSEEGVSAVQISAAEKLFDINYTSTERDSMINYLNRNLEGYKDLHNYTLPNEVPMSLYFDPHPTGFHQPTEAQIENIWEINESIKLPENINEIAFYSITELAGLIKSQQISSVELTKFFLDRLKKYNDTLKCAISITEDLAMIDAARADDHIRSGNYKGPLHGIPYGIKDLFAVEGYPTTWGAAPFKNQIFDYDATIISKLRDAGAVLVAKLSSGALASGDVWFGGKTLNPWNLEEGSSGSSAGPGSTTAAGLVAFSIGTETLGSIISPSTRCGITGLRPTFGRVSRAGGMTLSWSMDKAGPMARNAYDCAIILDAIHGADSLDRGSITVPFNYNFEGDFSELKIGYLKSGFDEQKNKNDSLTLVALKDMGIKMDSISLPDDLPLSGMAIIIRAEAGAIFEEITRNNKDDLMVRQGKSHRPTTLRQSHLIPATQYIQANRYRTQLIQKMDEVFSKYDVIVVPTRGFDQLLITNLTGHPALSVPNGFKEGSPTSFTIIGGLYKDAQIIYLANAYQNFTDFDEMHPESFLD